LLERHGIVTRDGVRAEGIPGGYGSVYGELKALETLWASAGAATSSRASVGAQFALGGAVERLRELRPREGDEPDALVLAAADPAQPYGAALPWPKRAGARAARVAGAKVVLLGGEPRSSSSAAAARSSRCATRRELAQPALAALVEHVAAAARRSASRSSASTASPSPRATRCRSWSRPVFSPDRAELYFGPKPHSCRLTRVAQAYRHPQSGQIEGSQGGENETTSRRLSGSRGCARSAGALYRLRARNGAGVRRADGSVYRAGRLDRI
jgi:hypothetical protein